MQRKVEKNLTRQDEKPLSLFFNSGRSSNSSTSNSQLLKSMVLLFAAIQVVGAQSNDNMTIDSSAKENIFDTNENQGALLGMIGLSLISAFCIVMCVCYCRDRQKHAGYYEIPDKPVVSSPPAENNDPETGLGAYNKL